MSRLRVPVSGLAPGTAPLAPETARYVVRVHRLCEGDRFVAFDPARAVEADAEVVEIGRRETLVRFGPERSALVRPARRVTLIQCIGKSDTFDDVVRDATELGATRVVPALAARSIVRVGAHDALRRAARYQKIAVEAARQCGRGDVPAIAQPMPLVEALALCDATNAMAAFCLHPEANASLGRALVDAPLEAELLFVVGPEGGLTTDEIETAVGRGAHLVTLGPIVLRTETVCAAVLGAALAFDQARRPSSPP